MWEVIAEHLGNPGTSWSIGVQGALAEFMHTDAPSRRLDEWTVASDLGAIRVTPVPDATLRAYEEPSAHAESWSHGVAICYPGVAAAGAPNRRITELGPDTGAIRVEHQREVLFDLGLGSTACRFCVRLALDDQIAAMRELLGRSAFDAHVMDALLSWQPHRVVMSIRGRIEVYQPIGSEKTPDGPHTHLIPRLLRPDAVTSANVPLPDGCTAGLLMYPESPLVDRFGRRKPFSETHHARFQKLLAEHGDPAYLRAKREAEHGSPPSEDSRLARLAGRIAKRQALAREKTPVHG
ncbi:MAG TPA: hypothetical protein VNU64_13405 [Burkholderiales bacterium]|nr:hypothetical protein [Burkholderiales bacterium]